MCILINITQILTRLLKGANISGLFATSSGGKPPNCSQLPKHSNIYKIRQLSEIKSYTYMYYTHSKLHIRIIRPAGYTGHLISVQTDHMMSHNV